MKVDLHIHSEYSDGTDSVEKLAKKIKNENLNIVALTDHDTTDGIYELKKVLPDNITLINGIELTCFTDNTKLKCHILGYYINPDTQEMKNLILKGRQLRLKKLETRINYLKDVWNIELTKEELDWLYSRRSIVKTHIANIIVNRGLAENNIEAMKKYLDACKTGNTRFNAKEAIDVIKKSGGIPIWAHPLGGEGEAHTQYNIFEKQLKEMMQIGIEGLECYYSRYSKPEIDFLVDTANKNKLYISGGSDYHGSNKNNIELCMLNNFNENISSEKLTILSKL